MSGVTPASNAVAALLAEPGVARAVENVTNAVAQAAARVAPKHTGHLAGSYHATPATTTRRGVEATAYTDDLAGHLAEWGSVNNPAYAPLRRGAERVGLDVRPAQKRS